MLSQRGSRHSFSRDLHFGIFSHLLLGTTVERLKRAKGNLNTPKLPQMVKGYNLLHVRKGSKSERKWKRGKKDQHVPSSREEY